LLAQAGRAGWQGTGVVVVTAAFLLPLLMPLMGIVIGATTLWPLIERLRDRGLAPSAAALAGLLAVPVALVALAIPFGHVLVAQLREWEHVLAAARQHRRDTLGDDPLPAISVDPSGAPPSGRRCGAEQRRDRPGTFRRGAARLGLRPARTPRGDQRTRRQRDLSNAHRQKHHPTHRPSAIYVDHAAAVHRSGSERFQPIDELAPIQVTQRLGPDLPGDASAEFCQLVVLAFGAGSCGADALVLDQTEITHALE
jgi:hypothetical protein